MTDRTASLGETRRQLQRVGAHILGRRRFAVSGRFGLRSSPGGFATPAFGEGPEVLRVAGETLIREVGASASCLTIEGSSLTALAAFAEVDLAAAFDCGRDGPPVGPLDEPIHLDARATTLVASWFAFGWEVLDAVTSSASITSLATIQLWPEHFDAATTVEVTVGRRANLGASAGDDYEPGPYLYVGPWGDERPGERSYWNAPFGAVLRLAELEAAADTAAAARRFFLRGVSHLMGAAGDLPPHRSR